MKNIKTAKQYEDIFMKNKGQALKTLVAIYKGNYYKFFLSVVFFVIKHSPAWVLPIVTANIINAVVKHDAKCMEIIMINALVMVFLVVLNVPMNYLHVKYKSLAVREVESGLRGALVSKLQHLSIPYHTELQSGRLQSKIMRDVEAIEAVSTQLFIGVLNIATNLIIALSITASKSGVVFIFFLLSAPSAALTMVLFRTRIKARNQEFRKEMEETSAKVMEMVELIPITRAHSLEETETKKITAQLLAVAEKGYRLDMIQSTFGAVSWAIFQIFQIGCLAFTGYLAFKGNILSGDIVLYQTYFTTIVNQVSSIIMLMPIISKGLESINSVGEILTSDNIEDNEGKEKIEIVNGAFRFENVKYTYPNTEKSILNGVNLKVNKGETIAFVGESGAGKTTLLNMIIGFILPDEGRIYIDGQDMSTLDLRTYRKHIAVVPQNTILFSGSIRDNITYGIDNVTDKEIENVIKAANLKDLVDSLPDGVDTKIGEHGGKLSGGQRQRLAIARALIRNPKVIILDEATSALDSISERLIQDALDNLTKERTTFIVAHRLSTIKEADKIAVMDAGRCIEYGTYDELMEKQGAFYKLKKTQEL
ncbi:MAG: ABC transporter ATP-binding protein [Lachnospiraceae bacterium]|nr:ABC transporter ATP-binding protein [Lachnospira sp.]MBQ8730727.1 ABC transporter ATP-binding protein [Lachnospiraceae bacterium]MBR6697864.1 ABC transporter ATP-binding protein [Lachnospiraceae bacterium]